MTLLLELVAHLQDPRPFRPSRGRFICPTPDEILREDRQATAETRRRMAAEQRERTMALIVSVIPDGTFTRQDLVTWSGVSKSTINKAIILLMEDGKVEKVQKELPNQAGVYQWVK
jgi:transcription initiation factor IIE alpha subunit